MEGCPIFCWNADRGESVRGIEGALHVLERVREGRFAAEALREAGAEMSAGDLSLASSLVYIVLRREEMWRRIAGGFLKKSPGGGRPGRGTPRPAPDALGNLPTPVADCLLLGTAGLLELRHFAGGVLVNGLLEHLKGAGHKRFVPLANAVLHGVGERGAARVEAFRRSSSLEERALWAGVPVWSLPAWTKSWKRPELSEIFELMRIPPASSLRVSPGRRDALVALLGREGMEAEPSDLSDALRLPGTVLPSSVPGFDRGWCTVQTEGSILAASLVERFWQDGAVLDMCSGRGVKAGQILQALPEGRLECWELSRGRHASAAREMRRLGLEGRAELRCGNALELEPQAAPSVVLLDAPCSGSGTWNRKPESKWKLDWQRFDRLVATQKSLLDRALALCAPNGIIIYVTCSLLRQENENVVAEVLAGRPGCVEVPAPWPEAGPFRRGRPWGTYVWPASPWLDGFYCAIIMKRAEA